MDDGSTDATASILTKLRREWPQLRVIHFRRNSGHQAALTAGLHNAFGDYVVSIDADLQDPPEKITAMLELARANNLDIVFGVQSDRSSDTFFTRHTSGLYYGLMRRLVGIKGPFQGGDFRLLSRAAVEALRSLPEKQPVTVCWFCGLDSRVARSPTAATNASRARRSTRCPRWPSWPWTRSPTSPRPRCA